MSGGRESTALAIIAVLERMRVTTGIAVILVVLIFSAVCFSQLRSSRCDSNKSALEDCTFLTRFEPVQEQVFISKSSTLDHNAVPAESSEAATNRMSPSTEATIASMPPQTEGFHWRQALSESFTFLVIEQAYVVHTDFNWVVSENGIPFNHYWRDYMQSLTSWWRAGWSAGEDPLYNYVGHPIQGALTGYIEVQNDPKSEKLEFSNTKAYWRSRLKATIWNAVYSTQWSIGPLSEMTVEKYGTKDRPPWNANGSFPCNTKTCYSGVGKVNLVMTPAGGFGWMLAEDILDKKIAEGLVENHTHNRLLINAVRSALNPIRGGANILHGKRPWYRASRDAQVMSLFREQNNAVSTSENPKMQVSHRGDVFFGYSHMGPSHCEATYSGALTGCNALSAKASSLSGWNIAVEKKYLRYFGAVADFSWQYGSASQSNFLFGPRGGASIGRFRPFAQVLFGAVHARENGTPAPKSDTTFAEDLGVGVDFRLMRLLSWRIQTDELKTGSPTFERRNLRLTSGLAVRF
jgi:hypothetical protein